MGRKHTQLILNVLPSAPMTVDTKTGAQKKKKKAALKELARKVKLEQQQGDVEMEC